MTQIGRQADHLARWVFAGPVPVDHRAHGEGVAQIVDARPPAMPLVLLFGTQADLLAYLREVVAGRTVGEPGRLVGYEQRPRRTTDQPVAFDAIVEQSLDGAGVERQQPLLAVLALSDAQHTIIGVEVVAIQRERLEATSASL